MFFPPDLFLNKEDEIIIDKNRNFSSFYQINLSYSFRKVNIAEKGLKEATKTNPLFVLFWAVFRPPGIVRAV